MVVIRAVIMLAFLAAMLALAVVAFAEPGLSSRQHDLPDLNYSAVYDAILQREDFGDGDWDISVSSRVHLGDGSYQSYANKTESGAWKISVKYSRSFAYGGLMTSSAYFWLNFTVQHPVRLKIKVFTSYSYTGSPTGTHSEKGELYFNNQLVASSASLAWTEYAFHGPGTVSLKVLVSANLDFGSTEGSAALNATLWVDGIEIYDHFSGYASVNYTLYDGYTLYTISLSPGGVSLENATVQLPGDFVILSSTPAYTGRNTTHVIFQLVSASEIRILCNSTAKVASAFDYSPEYNTSLADPEYVRRGASVITTPHANYTFLANATGYFSIGEAGAGKYQFAAAYLNSTHANMLLSAPIYVVDYELTWTVDNDADKLYVNLKYTWKESWGEAAYYPAFTIKLLNFTGTGSNGYGELNFTEDAFSPPSAELYVYDEYSIIENPIQIPVRNLTITQFEAYGESLSDVHFVVTVAYSDGYPFTGRLYFTSNAVEYPHYLEFNASSQSYNVLIKPYGGGVNCITVSGIDAQDNGFIVLTPQFPKLQFIVSLRFDEVQIDNTYERGQYLSGGFFVSNAGNFSLDNVQLRVRLRWEKTGTYYFDRTYNISFGTWGNSLPPGAGAAIILDDLQIPVNVLEGNYTLRLTFTSNGVICLAEIYMPVFVGKYYDLVIAVVDQNNKPTGGIKIVTYSIDTLKVYSGITDVNGFVKFHLPAGNYVAYAENYTLNTWTTFVLNNNKVLRFQVIVPKSRELLVIQQPVSITEGLMWIVLVCVAGGMFVAALKFGSRNKRGGRRAV